MSKNNQQNVVGLFSLARKLLAPTQLKDIQAGSVPQHVLDVQKKVDELNRKDSKDAA